MNDVSDAILDSIPTSLPPNISVKEVFSDVLSDQDETSLTFLEVFTKKQAEIQDETLKDLPLLSVEEEWVKDVFASEYDIAELLIETRLMSLTREYPDPYHEYYSPEISLYIFSTKSYEEVQKIFELVWDEEGFSLNETNSFGTWSFFINTNEDYNRNDEIRVVFEYQNKAFWLKIKKDEYNTVKTILQNL